MSFNDFLNELICKNDNETGSDNDNNCLITYEPLEPHFIKLECDHKFNYLPIFNEIKRQKTVSNYRETQRLSKRQLKCPYCRNVQQHILPPKVGFPKILFVNSPIKYSMMPHKCSYLFASGKKKNQCCSKPSLEPYCTGHKTIMDKRALKSKKIGLDPPTCCSAITKKGTHCSRKKILGTQFCKQHSLKSYNKTNPQNAIIHSTAAITI